MFSIREAKPDEYARLLERSKEHLPASITVHGWLEVFVTFGRPKISKSQVWILEKHETFPLFIVITDSADAEFQSLNIFWDPKLKDDSIKKMLKCLPNFNWQKPFFLSAVTQPVVDQFCKMVQSEHLCGNNLHRVIDEAAYIFEWYPLSSVDIPLPDGFRLDSLKPEHTHFVHENWANNIDHPPKMIDYFINTLGSSAIFTDDPEFKDEPVSWSIFKIDGQVGATYTHPKFRSKKLGSIVTIDLYKKMLSKSVTPYAVIGKENPISLEMHKKLGFRLVCEANWEFYVGEKEDQISQSMKDRIADIDKSES